MKETTFLTSVMLYAVGLIICLMLIACSSFPVGEYNFKTDQWWSATDTAARTLEDRGWRVDESSTKKLTTHWRSIRLYPGHLDETWIKARIHIRVAEHGTVTVECMEKEWGQSKADLGYREPPWRTCRDPDVLRWVRGTAKDISYQLGTK